MGVFDDAESRIETCDTCQGEIITTEWGSEVGHKPTCSKNPNKSDD
jgi:hypothetical protein